MLPVWKVALDETIQLKNQMNKKGAHSDRGKREYVSQDFEAKEFSWQFSFTLATLYTEVKSNAMDTAQVHAFSANNNGQNPIA